MLSFIRASITSGGQKHLSMAKNVSNITQDLYLIDVYEPDDQAIHKGSGPGSWAPGDRMQHSSNHGMLANDQLFISH